MKLLASQEARAFADDILKLLREDPHGWKVRTQVAQYGEFELWIANRPYADMTMRSHGEIRIGTRRQRRALRRAVDAVLFMAASTALLEEAHDRAVEVLTSASGGRRP